MLSFGRNLLLSVVLLSVSPQLAARQAEKNTWTRPFMGTIFHITVCVEDPKQAETAVFKAFDRIEELEGMLSYYREESDLNQLAASAHDSPVIAGPDLFEILEASLYWSRRTGGAFDSTIRPLINLWHSCGSKGVSPTGDQIREAREKTGYEKVLINPRLKSVRLLSPEMKLDLGGIAKGFAADEARKILRAESINSVLIDAGGDLTMGDPPSGEPGWLVKLDNTEVGTILHLSNCAIATSGDKYKYYDINGTRYSHIVDPSTGLGMTDHRQVTVMAPDGRTADALATALSVMEIKQGLELVDSLEGIEVLIRVITPSMETGEATWFKSANFPESR